MSLLRTLLVAGGFLVLTVGCFFLFIDFERSERFGMTMIGASLVLIGLGSQSVRLAWTAAVVAASLVARAFCAGWFMVLPGAAILDLIAGAWHFVAPWRFVRSPAGPPPRHVSARSSSPPTSCSRPHSSCNGTSATAPPGSPSPPSSTTAPAPPPPNRRPGSTIR